MTEEGRGGEGPSFFRPLSETLISYRKWATIAVFGQDRSVLSVLMVAIVERGPLS